MQSNELWCALEVMRGAPGEDVLGSLAGGVGERPHDVAIPTMETEQLACSQDILLAMKNILLAIKNILPATRRTTCRCL